MQFQIPKGLFDILPYGADKEWRLSNRWQYIEAIIRKLTLDYGFKEIRTPIFERTELFVRGIGATSDIASKEMYTFLDKAQRSMSLRPEGTASVMRAFIEKNLAPLQKVHKLYYIAPMFRYDRPQAGRYRQHHQFGVEVIGNYGYNQDAEVIDMLLELFRRLGLKDLKLLINSIGDAQSRIKYKEALIKFLKPHFTKLSKESQERLEKNPLRVLDSKEPQDIELVKNAPSILNFLSQEGKDHFNNLIKLLDALKIKYEVNDKLVRGLDYYDDTVFEVVSSELGSQNSLGGGGRYNSLLKSFGGADLPGFGFGAGLERILTAMQDQNIPFPNISKPFVYFIPLGDEAQEISFMLTTKLRHKKIPVDIDLNAKKIQKSLANASKLEAQNCIIIGDEEIKEKKVQFKNLESREQKGIAVEKVIDFIEEQYQPFADKNYV